MSKTQPPPIRQSQEVNQSILGWSFAGWLLIRRGVTNRRERKGEDYQQRTSPARRV